MNRIQRTETPLVILILLVLLSFEVTVKGGGVVNTPDESALRAALQGGGEVTLAFDGTIVLTNTLNISNPTIIDSTGHEVTLSGGNSCRIFNLLPGASLLLKDLTLKNGLAAGADGSSSSDAQPGRGGAVYVDGGNFRAVHCAFMENEARAGDGVALDPLQFQLSAPGDGGAIYATNSEISLENCVLVANSATGGEGFGGRWFSGPGGDANGGAIFASGGEMNLISCVIGTNYAQAGIPTSVYGLGGAASGGAICLQNVATKIVGGIIEGNSCIAEIALHGQGGAIFQKGGTMGLLNTSLLGNSASGGSSTEIPSATPGNGAGGAVCLVAGSAGMTNVTFHSNLAIGGTSHTASTPGEAAGGAICSLSNVLVMVNCTVLENSAQAGTMPEGFQGTALGGAVYASQASVDVMNVTFTGNGTYRNPSADTSLPANLRGGNLYVENSVFSLMNSIVANGIVGSNCFGNLTDLGYNLCSDGSCGLSAPGSLSNIDPKLGPLGSYGGENATVPLLTESPALDAASPTTFPQTDQRGRARPFGSRADMGSFESSPPYVLTGTVRGATLNDEVFLQIDGSSIETIAGQYTSAGIPSGNHVVTPFHPDFSFIPAAKTLTFGPDRFGVDFTAYGLHTFTAEGISNGVLRVIYASTNGQVIRIESSTNLQHWTALETNVIDESGIWELTMPIDANPQQFLRTRAP